jgi:uncharacterized protein (DUF58 family)
VLAGEYISVFKGSGIEFDEVRPYLPGDDVRSIDWNVTARTGQPFIKRYVEERQLTIMLMADVSASQEFGSGTRSKREAAAEFCALLAFSAIRSDDKVGLLLFHGDVEQYIPPRKGQKHALRVIREVLSHERTPHLDSQPQHGWRRLLQRPQFANLFSRRDARSQHEATDIARALEFFLSINKRRAVCFVVSDFIDSAYEKALRAANAKHDVVAVLITDPHELQAPDVGLVALRDAESGERRIVDAGSASFRRDVERTGQARIDDLRKSLNASGIDLIHIDASGSVVDPVVQFFHARGRRARR